MSTRVVIVDDDPQITALCRSHLEASGAFEVIGVCETAAEGYYLALEQGPGVVLIDLGLPDRSGETLIRDLFRALPDSMVAAFTATDAEVAEQRVRATGAFAYYEKDMLRDGQLVHYLGEDLDLFVRAVGGEDVVAPSAIQRRGDTPPGGTPARSQ
jgi:DNA-binding NarL/FixJ family response regulator